MIYILNLNCSELSFNKGLVKPGPNFLFNHDVLKTQWGIIVGGEYMNEDIGLSFNRQNAYIEKKSQAIVKSYF